MTLSTIYTAILFVFCVFLLRKVFILYFKCSYYETKLENRDVDISHIKSINSLKEIRDL